jgi:hypothetical protein
VAAFQTQPHLGVPNFVDAQTGLQMSPLGLEPPALQMAPFGLAPSLHAPACLEPLRMAPFGLEPPRYQPPLAPAYLQPAGFHSAYLGGPQLTLDRAAPPPRRLAPPLLAQPARAPDPFMPHAGSFNGGYAPCAGAAPYAPYAPAPFCDLPPPPAMSPEMLHYLALLSPRPL